MRRALAAFSAAGVVVAAAAAVLGGTPSAASAGTISQQPVPVHRVNLHPAYEHMLTHISHGPIKYHPKAHNGHGRQSANAAAERASAAVGSKNAAAKSVSAATSCTTEPNCPVAYHGGPVQHTPHVYLLLWGPKWSTTGSAAAHYLSNFYGGLGGSQDNWSAVLTQYNDNSGSPSFSSPVFEGIWQDQSTPTGTGPNGSVDPNDIAAEAGTLAQREGITDFADAQVVVASQPGTCFDDGWGGQPSSCVNQPNKLYCAWHSDAYNSSTGANLPFVNLPYQPDAGGGCGENFVNSGSAGTYDGFSMSGGHEFAEVATDPYPPTGPNTQGFPVQPGGWIDNSDTVSGGEIGDKCAFGGELWGTPDPYGNVTFTTGRFAMQSLWSNETDSCAMSAGRGGFVPVGPVRVLDTRNGTGGHSGPVGSGQTISVQVAGRDGVPSSGVTAVVLNVTAVSPNESSYVTVYPDGESRPTASNLNFTAGETFPNLVVVPVGADGKVDLYNLSGSVNLVADLAGYYTGSGGSRFDAAGPVRMLDTRYGTGGYSGPVGSGQSISLQVTGKDGVPSSGVTAVVLNVTAVDATQFGYVTVYPDGTSRPAVSNLNFTAGEVFPNLVVVPVGADGKVDFYNHNGSVNLVADLAGYYTSGGSLFDAAGPVRMLDTRNGTGGHSGPVGPGQTISLQVTGKDGVPASGVTAVVLNVTAVDPTGISYVTVYPDGTSRPVASNLNFTAGEVFPNLVVVPVGSDGKVDLYNRAGNVNLVADLAGYYMK